MALDSVTFNTQAALKDSKTDADTGITVDTYYDATTFEIIGVENKDAGGNTTFKSTKTEDTTGYSAAADVAADAALNLTGAKAAGGKVTNTTAEKVSITSAGDDSGIFYDVTGKNAAGEVVTERVAGANDGTAQTTAAFLEVTEVKAVGTPADKVSLAGEGYTEVVEQTETRKETNAAGEKVDVTFTVEKTINYDGGDKIKSGTEKIDGKEKTLGENGVVTAEVMDTSVLGDAVSGDVLAAVVARYDAVTDGATVYADAEIVGDGVTLTTLYAANGTIVGSSDTAVETFGDMTLTVTNHLDATGAYVGTEGTDGTNTWTYTEALVTTNGVDTRVETGTETYGGETRTFSYVFNVASGDLISGTELVGGITTTFGANWAITAESIDTSALGAALSSSVLDDLPASVQAASGNTYSKTETFDWGGGETTYFNAQGVTTGFAYTWADASGNSNNSYYDAQDNYVGDSWSDAEGRSGSSSVAIAADGSKVETGSYADTNNSSDDSSWTYNFNSAGEMTGGSEVRGATTTNLGANWSVTGQQVAVGGLSQLNLDNVDDTVETAFFTIDADGISVSADVANNAALVIGGALSAGGTATNTVAASVSIASAGDDSAIKFTVVGTNAAGAALTETVNGTNAGIALSTGEFKTITSITAVGDPAGKVTAGARHTTIYQSTETFDWGGSLTTFLDAGGNIKGYADSYSDDWDGDGNVDSSGTTYMLSDWSYAGSEWSDSWGTGEQWVATLAADGSPLASGHTREFGKHEWSNGQGGTETREFDYTWDSNYNLVEGKETGSDGVTIEYGANWEILSQKGDTSKLGDALTSSELSGVPDAIQSTLTGADAGTYAKSTVYDWGTDITYYDSTGAILGYANSSSWDTPEGGKNTNKGYHDADWNWLGGSWADLDASGGVIRSGSNSTVNTYGTDDNGDPIKTSFVDSGSYREGDEGDSYSWSFDVTYDANGYENHEMTGGTEVRGTYNAAGVLVGTTYTYGANWTLEGAKADTSNLETLDLSGLDASLVTALFGSANAVIKYSTETFDWNQGFSQQTYYDGVSGDIVGYGDSWSDDWDGDGNVDSSGKSFMDENWDYVGGSWSDDYGSGHNFSIKTVVNNVVTQRQEIGENTWMDYDGTAQTNKFDFIYDGDWNLISGTEERGQKAADGTLSGGEKITYGANWEILSVSRDVNLASEKIAELSVADLNGIPTALHADGTTYDSDGVVTGWATDKKTYTETEVNPWGTQVTYLDSDGQILGYSDGWSDDWDGDGTPDSVGTSYQDADWNHLGSSYDDQWSTGFHHTVESTLNGNKVYIESGSRTDKNADGSLGEVTTNEFIFDENWNMISGTETRGNTTTTFGANWVILSQETSMFGVGTVDVSGLPASVQTLLFTGETLTAVKALTEDFSWGGSQTTYFDVNGNVLGYMDTYSDDWDGDGTVDSSGTSFMDENWNHIGGTYSDEWGSGSNFTVVTYVNGEIESRLESGTSTWKNYEGNEETRTFEYKYDADWNLIEGEETSSDGTTITYGANWEVLGSKVSMANMVALTSAQLVALTATPLKATSDFSQAAEVAANGALVLAGKLAAGGSITNETAQKLTITSAADDSAVKFNIVGTAADGSELLEQVTGANAGTATSQGLFKTIASITAVGDPVGLVSAGGETFSKVSDWGQTTYFDSNGVILGYYDSWSDNYNGETHVGESYMDANWNHLGGSNKSTDSNGNVMYENSSIRVKNLDLTETETGTNSWHDGTSLQVSSYTFNFDANGNMTGGEEVRPDGTIVRLGADWTFLGEAMSATKLASAKLLVDADADGISVAAQVADDAQLVIGGALASSGSVTNAVAQQITIVSSGNDAGISFTVVGTNAAGAVLTETVAGANAGTATSVGSFLTITGVTAVGDPAGTVSVGIAGDKAGIPTALLSTKIDGVTKYTDESHNEQGGTGSTMAGTSFQRTFFDSDGTILGFMDSWSDTYGSGSSFMDANWNWLGGSGSDDWAQWSQVSEDIMTGGNKTGTKDTRTENMKNMDGNDTGDQYTGQTMVTVTEYDLDFMMTKMTQTTTFTDGTKMEFVFNENFEVVGEYSYDSSGTKTITDKYALFQLEKFQFTDDYMKAYAQSEGITNLVDGDGDGVIDAYADDYDNDGISDLSNSFGQNIIDATVFFQAADDDFLLDNNNQRVLENPAQSHNDQTNPYVLIGDPVISWSGTAFLSAPTSLSISANGLEMVLTGDLVLTAQSGNFNLGWLSGNITSSYVYDTTTTGEPLVAYADNLNIDWADLSSFMMAQPDMGPPPVMLGTGPDAVAYEIFDDGHNSTNAKTKVDQALYVELESAGFDLTGITKTDNTANQANITEAMLQALAPAPVYNLNGMDYAVANHPSGASSTVDFDLYLKLADLGAPAGIALAEGAAITQAAVDWLITNDVPPVLTLTQMMGGANALTAISDSLASDGMLMGMGAEQRYDPMGNLIRVMDDGYGNLTETMTDPLNANIEIKTEYLASGEVRVTQLITDPNTKVVQEVSMGSGSRVENDFYDEITTNVDGKEVTERDYDMANVYSKIERGDGGAYTEKTKDALGVEVRVNAAADGSFVEKTISADGKSELKLDVNSSGVGTLTKEVTAADGSKSLVEMGSVVSTTVDGVRTDITQNFEAVITAGVGTNPATTSYVPDGTYSKVVTYDDGFEVWTSYNADGVEVSSSARTVLENGASVHRNVVNGLEVVVTYTTQADASLKAVYQTPGGTTLKEELTTYDAAGAPTVTAKEFLGVDHTRVTVSDAETTTVVTTEANGAVIKAVKDIAADKTVTTTVDAAKAVTVTEQVGTSAAVTTATGTLTVATSGTETIELKTVNSSGTETGSETITVYDGGTITVTKDANGLVLESVEEFGYNDGKVWTETQVGVLNTEVYTFSNGETETIATNTSTGAITVTQQLLVDGVLVTSTKATGTSVTVDGVNTQTFDLGNNQQEIRVWDPATGVEETTFKTGSETTRTLKWERDDNGNDVIEELQYSNGAVTQTVETVVGVDGTAQEKEISATGEITLKESGIDGSGNAFEKVLGTGTSETVNGVTTDTITLSDNSTVTEKFDGTGALTEKVVADQAGDKKISTFDGSGAETIAYADVDGAAIEASEVDIKLDIGFANDDLGFVNVDYTDMASGFTSQADNFNLAVDYSNAELATSDGGYASGTYVNTNNGGNNTGGNNTGGNNTGGNNTGGNNTGGNNTGGNNTGGNNTGGDNTGGDNAGANNTGANNNVNVADYTDYSSFYGDGSTTGGYDYSYDIY